MIICFKVYRNLKLYYFYFTFSEFISDIIFLTYLQPNPSGNCHMMEFEFSFCIFAKKINNSSNH